MEKLKALRDDTSLSRREKLRKLGGIRAELTTKIEENLTPEQFDQWQKKRKELCPVLRQRAGRE